MSEPAGRPGLSGLPRTTAALEDGIAANLHLGAQLYVSLGGTPMADGVIGEASAGVPMTTDRMIIWFSMTKAVVAVAIAQLWDRGHLSLDDPVAAHVPEFAAEGKGRITLRHCLTHTGGFRTGDGVQSQAKEPDLWWDEVIAGICAVRPEPGWVPGQRAGYHLTASMMILGEAVRRVDGRPFSQYVRDEIFVPLGMDDCWVGMPRDRVDGYRDRIGVMHHTASGAVFPLDRLDSTGWLTCCIPSAGGRGPMRQLGRLYEALLGGGERDGTRILGFQAVEAITAVHRAHLPDQTTGVTGDFALGFGIDGATMGRHSSRRVFGHGGAMSAVAYADPEFGLAVAVQTNGMPSPEAHNSRFAAISAAIYEDLGLADPADPGRGKPFAGNEGAILGS